MAALLLALLCLARTITAQPRAEAVELKMRVTSSSLIVVPVFVNGIGPFEFVLDTGTTMTMVDEQVATQAGLEKRSRTTVVSVQSGETAMETAEAASLMLEGEEVRAVRVGVVPRLDAIPVKVHGVLGEDYLRRFDVLLDYGRGRMTLMTAGNSAAELICGERVALAVDGDAGGGVQNRPTVETVLPLMRGRARLLLDTGTDALVLFGRSARGMLGRPETVAVTGNAVSGNRLLGGRVGTIRLRLGDGGTEMKVLAVSAGSTAEMDVEGLLPASAFRAVFISHSGGYVVFNPVMRTEAQVAYYRAKLASR
jgi:predicted aspartyl protease